MKTFFHIQPGLVAVYGRIQENVVHRHNAIQLVWPESAASLTVDGTQCVAAAVIASRIPHQLTMDRGWVLLIEPHSALGHALTARLTGTPYVVLDEVALYQARFQCQMKR
ncbi:transcriptional regulator AraC family [Photobacterium aphoticum]|uniref:Transcriptional regulator AraC family n=1 Tax=Photobacterium aphoticum TaxID=754436 RepID=A0A090R5A5_9GAMM|nr:transcriptional regulator AraC family [Photobacterium aphoticum]